MRAGMRSLGVGLSMRIRFVSGFFGPWIGWFYSGLGRENSIRRERGEMVVAAWRGSGV